MSKSKIIVHPGVYIKEELEARTLSQRDLAYILGCPEQAITVIINGKRGISSEMAKALAIAFDVSPELFANLQQMYDLAQAKEPDSGITTRKLIQNSYPAREMIKRGWISATNDSELLEAQLINFFCVPSLDKIPHLHHAARKTYYDQVPPTQLAWLFRVKNLAKKINTPKYSEYELKNAVLELKELLSEPEEIKRIPNILLKAGIRFVIVESLPSSKIDGVCCWLDEHSPVIALSMRFDRIDNFWFNLRHEIEHVLRKDGLREEVIDIELGTELVGEGKVAKMEATANLAASNFIIPSQELKYFLTKNQAPSLKTITEFAKKIGVHPGLVIGQLQSKKVIPYSRFRKSLVKVRELLMPETAVVDGWGIVANPS
jgi:HTH-type transcriptional regulator / antitoxin HigA